MIRKWLRRWLGISDNAESHAAQAGLLETLEPLYDSLALRLATLEKRQAQQTAAVARELIALRDQLRQPKLLTDPDRTSRNLTKAGIDTTPF